MDYSQESNPDVNFFNRGPSNSSAAGNDERTGAIPFKSEPRYYDMSGDKYVIIFNHYEYQKTMYFKNGKPNSRTGTHKDVKKIKETFVGLGFEVIPFTDQKYEDIMTTMRDLSNRDHTHTSCLIIVILTHGEKGGELYAADRPYQLQDITLRLENGHETLVKVPKLLFIQACRGGSLDKGRRIEYDGQPANAHKMLVPTHINFLIMQSSVEDYISWRDEDGSWLIQELCEVIQEYHTSLDILQMIVVTTRNVALKRVSYTTNSKTNMKKATPETRFTLTKLLKL